MRSRGKGQAVSSRSTIPAKKSYAPNHPPHAARGVNISQRGQKPILGLLVKHSLHGFGKEIF
jgi:hypothetical protein